MRRDRQLYDALIEFLASEMQEGESALRFQVWELLEKLKNKYGGHVPPKEEKCSQ